MSATRYEFTVIRAEQSDSHALVEIEWVEKQWARPTGEPIQITRRRVVQVSPAYGLWDVRFYQGSPRPTWSPVEVQRTRDDAAAMAAGMLRYRLPTVSEGWRPADVGRVGS